MKDDSQQIFESIMEEVSKIESAFTNPLLNKVSRSENNILDESIKGLQKISDIIVQNTDMKGSKPTRQRLINES